MTEANVVSPGSKHVRQRRRKVISGKRYVDHKRFLERVNRRLKAKGLPRAKGRYPVGKSKPEVTTPKTRFPRSYVVQQGKSKRRLRKTKCFSSHIRRVRSSLVPGSILVLLAGSHKGKRVVLLKVLRSGLLLVTGPFKLNGVPLRRFNHRYVIATQTRVDLSGLDLPKHINDDYFKRVDLKDKEGDDKFLVEEVKKYTVSDVRKDDQKMIDMQVSKALKKHPDSKLLHGYLRSLFSLGKRDYPHRMVF